MMTPEADAPGVDATPPRRVVSVLMPVRNEGDHIASSVAAVTAQVLVDADLEVLVIDGDSTDDTAALAAGALRQAGAAITASSAVLHNPQRIVPSSMNLGLTTATGDVIVRVDGHCDIPADYVQRCLDLLDEHPEADCAGGALETVGQGWVARGIAAAQSSVAGVGNATFRTGSRDGRYVDTLAFGAYRSEVFARIGTFDEELVRNQDDELNFRLTQAGGKLWLDPTLIVRYHSRSSLRGLWRQYAQYGLYKVLVFHKRGAVAAPRQLVPAAFVVAAASSTTIGLLRRDARWPALVLGPYALVVTAATIDIARRDRRAAVAVPAALSTMHIAYGSGVLAGLWRWRHRFRRA